MIAHCAPVVVYSTLLQLCCVRREFEVLVAQEHREEDGRRPSQVFVIKCSRMRYRTTVDMDLYTRQEEEQKNIRYANGPPG